MIAAGLPSGKEREEAAELGCMISCNESQCIHMVACLTGAGMVFGTGKEGRVEGCFGACHIADVLQPTDA
jgi:hypothetical protein